MENSVYVIKIYGVDPRGQVIGVTGEASFGKQLDNSCLGTGGIPVNLRTFHIGGSSVTYAWDKPMCDENKGKIEGFEFMVSQITCYSV